LNFIKEAPVDTLFSEINAEMRRQRIMEEMNAIRLEQETAKGSHPLSNNLVSLGEWLIVLGERLRKQHSSFAAKARSAGMIHKAA
jgi:hypothetical protein